MVADALDVSFHRVRLVRLAGAELIDGQMSLKILGDLATSYINKHQKTSKNKSSKKIKKLRCGQIWLFFDFI